MSKFVCVRLVQANRLDLTKFQFDFDLTFAVFFMNSDGTIYSRYGTRSSRKEAERDMSPKGLVATMEGVLQLHQDYPKHKTTLVGKQAKATKYKTPNDYPMLRGKYKPLINYRNNTARSCLHCHQIHGAQQAVYRDAGRPIPDKLIYIYPMPDVIGLTLDPTTRSTVKSVEPKSSAAEAGVRAGDAIVELDGQSILSIADVQWVLHNADDADQLPVRLARSDGSISKAVIQLEKGWRRATDSTWRAGSWPLRRMGMGGIVLEPLTTNERKRAKLGATDLGVKIKGMGRFGPFATARRSGFKIGDIIVAFGEKTSAMSPSELLAYSVQATKPGQRIAVTVLRDGRRQQLRLPMQR